MELVGLRTFLAVVEEGGVLAASRKLNTVQSNVTSRIRRLEQELGAELFFRHGRGLSLSPPGRVLLGFAERMLDLERQTTNAVRQAGESAGELRLGAMETFAALHLPRGLRAVRDGHPGVRVTVYTDTSVALVERLLAHRLDCAFVAGPLAHPLLRSQPLIEEELVRVGDPARDDQPLILFREGCAYRARALEWQRRVGQAASAVMELGTLEGILGCVSAGLGWTLLPRRVAEQSSHVAGLSITPLDDPLARVPTLLVCHADSPALPALETLADAVRRHQASVGAATDRAPGRG